MKISVLQQIPRFDAGRWMENPDWNQRRKLSEQTIDDCLELLKRASQEGADLAVTIESVNMIHCYGDCRYSGKQLYEDLDGPIVKRFSKAAKEYGMYIVAGLILVIDNDTYNCAVLFDAEGKIAGIHKKVHLPAGEEVIIASGNEFVAYETPMGRVGMLVCWDMQFPEAARELALQGVDLIVCPTLGWENIYGLSRAYENSVYIAAAMGVNYDGMMEEFCDPSCIVDNMGHIIKAARRDTMEVVTAEVDLGKEPVPQYGSEKYIRSYSMRETRLRQRRPDTYHYIGKKLEELPLYCQYEKEIRGN